MAKDKGYIAKIGADVSGFSEAMQQIKKDTGTLTKELNSVNHALKLDPTNTVLQAQKLELLKEKANIAAKELEELTRAKETMERVGNDGTAEGAAALREYQREVEKCKRSIADYNNYQTKLSSGSEEIDKITQSTDKAANSTANWAQIMKGDLLSSAIQAGFQALLDVIKRVGDEVLNTGKNYQTALSQVAATYGVDRTTEEYNALAVAAEHMGATTKYNAAQSAEALNYLALAGYSVREAIADLPTVLNLAQAGSMDLSRTSDMLTDSMSALGLITADMDENMKAEAMQTFADQMAKASQRANASVADMGEAILAVGASAQGLKGGSAELNTMLGVLADIGIKVSEGGIHLRNILKTFKEESDTFKSMGVDVYDLEGNLNYLPDIIGQLNDSLDGLTQAQRDKTILDLFNSTDLAAINGLLGTTSERFAQLNEEITNSAGTCAEMAAILNDNLDGAITSCSSAWEGFAIALYNALDEDMQGVVEGVTSILQELKEGINDEDFNSAQLEDYVEKVNNFITNFSADLKEKLNKMGMEILPTLFRAINDNIQDVSKNATDVILVFVKGLVNSLPYIIEGGVKIVAGVVQGIGESLPELLPVCLKVIGEIAENLANNVDTLIDAAYALIEGLGEALTKPDTIEQLAVAAGKIVVSLAELIVQSAYNMIFCGAELIDSLAEGMANGIENYDWDGIGYRISESLYNAIRDSLKRMPTITINGQEWVPFANVTKEEFDDIFDLKEVYSPDTAELGAKYLSSLRKKTKDELEQLKRDIIIERNNAEDAWALYAQSGKDSINDYLDSVTNLSEKHKTILKGIADTAKSTATTEADAYNKLYSSMVLANGRYSQSYLQFAAVQDTLDSGDYLQKRISLSDDHWGFNFGDNTGADTNSDNDNSVSSNVSTKYDEQIESDMKDIEIKYAQHKYTEEEYYKERANVLKRYTDEESLIYWKYRDEVDAYYAKQEEEAKKRSKQVQEEADKKQKAAEEEKVKLLKAGIQTAAAKAKTGKTNKDVTLVNEGIAELKDILATLNTDSDVYEECLAALNDGKEELVDLQSTLTTMELRQQQQDIEYQQAVNERAYGELEAAKRYYEDIKQYVESIEGTAYYKENEQTLRKKLWSAEDAYKTAYLKDYKANIQSQIDTLDEIKKEFEDSVVGDKWYAEQLQAIIDSIDNADIASAFESKLLKAKNTVQKNADAAEKAIMQAAEKYQSAIQYFRAGESLDGKDISVINDLQKQREQIQEITKGMQQLRERGFSEDYITDAVKSLSISDGSRQKALNALLGLTDEQIKQEMSDYEGLKADMLELAKVENTDNNADIADSAVNTATNALSKAITEAYKIGKNTADSFNKGLIDGLGGSSNSNVLSAQQALAAQGIDTTKTIAPTTNTVNSTTVVDNTKNVTVAVSVAGTEVIRKTVDDMLRDNVISGGNNLYI